MGTITSEQTRAALTLVRVVGETIQSLGTVPSGHLYAHVMSTIDIHTYEHIIEILVKAKLVRKDAWHQLTWIGGDV